MKAAVLHEPGKLQIEDVPVPAVSGHEVLVKIKATAICGTDVALYKGKYAPKYLPIIQGHESVGIVAEIGENVTKFSAGDRVIINPAFFCGDCPCCINGLSNICLNGGLLGKDQSGTFAEYVAVNESSLTPLPQDITFEDATSLQSLTSVLRAWERVSVKPGETVAVIGMGAPGLLHVQMAAMSGGTVFAITRSHWKLDIAARYGAKTIGALDVDPVKAVKEATGGKGVDLVIDTAGTQETMAQALNMARFGGTVMLYAVPHKVENLVLYPVFAKELTILGSRGMNQKGYADAVALYQTGKLDLTPFVTHRFHLEDTAKMFDIVDSGSEKTLRAVCVFD